jgi:hypothetical protein
MNKSWQKPGEAEISYTRPDYLVLGQFTAIANNKIDI